MVEKISFTRKNEGDTMIIEGETAILAHVAKSKRNYNSIYTEYGDDEMEFLRAIEKYKHNCNRPNPTCCEILEILKSLGYKKVKHE